MLKNNLLKISGVVFVFVFMLTSTAQAITWTDANDGTGSGLDADLLDGLNSTSFLRSDTSGAINGSLNVTGSIRGRNVTSGINPGHRHTGISVSDLTVSSFTSTNISQWNNDLGYIIGYTETDPKVGILSNLFLPYWNGSTLTDSSIAVNGGNVGIGTTSPTAKLQVAAPDYNQIAYFSGNTGNNYPTQNFGLVIAENFSNGNAEMDLWNVMDPAIYPNTGIRFLQQTGASSYNDLLFLKNNVNVGIGTTSPDELLSINAAAGVNRVVSYKASGTTKGYVGLGIDNVMRVQTTDTANLALNTNNTDVLTVTGTGNVGIGTTGPLDKLDIQPINYSSSQDGGISIKANGGAANGIWQTRYALKSDSGGVPRVGIDFVTRDYTTGAVASNVEAISIIASGNVGIGTTIPLGRLHVNTGTDQNLFVTAGPAYTGVDGIALVSVNNANAAYRDLNVAAKNIVLNASGGTGNVGIGTTSPSYKLDVYGTTHFEGDQTYIVGTHASAPALHVRNSGGSSTVAVFGDTGGNVGIGTTSPDELLSINAAAGVNRVVSYKASGTTKGYIGLGTDNVMRVQTTDTANLALNTNNADVLTVTGTGNVGIGTASPDVKLQVIGGDVGLGNNEYLTWRKADNSANDGEVYLDSSNQLVLQSGIGEATLFKSNNGTTEWMRINSGNVGIGTASPDATLDVNGSMRLNGEVVYVDPDAATDHSDAEEVGSIAYYLEQMETTGGTIYLRPGTYYVQDGLRLYSNVSIIGSGANSVIQLSPGYDTSILKNAGATGDDDGLTVHDVLLENFTVSGDTSIERDCIIFNAATDDENERITMKGLTVRNCGSQGVLVLDTNDLVISDSFLYNNGTSRAFDHNMYLRGVDNATIENIVSTDAAGNGFNASESNGLIINNYVARENGGHGIRVSNSFNIVITSCIALNNGYAGIMFVSESGGVEDALISGCLSKGNGDSGVDLGDRNGITIHYSDEVTISGCTVSGSNMYGIYSEGSSNDVVTGNNLMLNGPYDPDDSTTYDDYPYDGSFAVYSGNNPES